MNRGNATAAASTNRYYLSLNKSKGAGDVLLTGTRAVPQLAAGASSTGTVSATIPAGSPVGTYYLLMCGDDRAVVSESNETNCRASTTTMKVS